MSFSSNRNRDFDHQSPAMDGSQGRDDGIGRYFSELKEYAAYFASAKWDGVKLSLRQVVIHATLGLLVGCVAGAILVMSVVLLLDGIAGGLGVLFGGRPWLGNLVVGAVLLGLLAGGMMLGMKRVASKSKQKTVEKYESRKRRQRNEYGHDVRQRAHETQG